MPILDQHSLEIISRSPEQTRRAGMRLGELLEPGDVVCLQGELGAGKTTLVQGIAAGWGSLDQVTSPTFVLVNVYRRPGLEQFFHLDAYRLAGASEAEELDLEDMLHRGPLVVEWAERIEAALPKECLWIELRWMGEQQRDLTIHAKGTHNQVMLQQLRKRVYGVP